MNYFQFPVSFGSVFVFWDSQGLLARIELLPGSCAHEQSLLVPIELAELIRNLRGYFGTGVPVGDIPWKLLNLNDLTEFQFRVYQLTAQIPHGETRTYGWIAKQLGKPSASRAVGQALRRNPFPVLVPCHRVVGAHGLGGFLGEVDESNWFYQIKSRLILLEEEYLNPMFSFLPAGLGASDYLNTQVFSV